MPRIFTDFFSSFRGNRCWVESSLFSAHKVIIPLRSQLSALNSKCAEQPSGNSEDVQSFPDGIVVRAGEATGAVLRRLSHRRHIWADLGVCGLNLSWHRQTVHKPGKRDKKSRKAVSLIRETSQQNQYNKTVINKTTTNQGSKGVNTIQGKTHTQK